MKDILYAPWRDEYVTNQKIEGCVFCHISTHAKDRQTEEVYIVSK